MTIVVGTKLKNNDPRKNGEIVTVTFVDSENGYAYYHTGKRKAKIALGRISPAGTFTARGYNIASPEDIEHREG